MPIKAENFGAGEGEKVKVSEDDLEAQYLDEKIVVTPDLTKTVLNPGGIEQLQIGLYTGLSILSFTNTVGAVEIGSTVDDVTFNWILNSPGQETSQTLTSYLGVENIPPGTYTRAYAGLGLTVEESWTLQVTDGISVDTAISTIHFHNKRYWGADANPGPLTDPDILALSGNELATARQCTKYFDCTGGKYIWIVYPEDWGAATFWVGGLQVTFLLTVQDHTNASGWTESYRVYRSEYLQNGSNIDVEVR